MASLKIYDLKASTPLDKKALATINGGLSFGWLRPYVGNRPSTPFGTVIGQLQIFNVSLVNPVFNRITNTVNQVEYVTIDASENIDSFISVDVDQGQAGRSRSLPLPI